MQSTWTTLMRMLAELLWVGGFVAYGVYTTRRYYGQPPSLPDVRASAPLAPWLRVACAAADRGALWIEEPEERARAMLSQSWEIRDAASWSRELATLLTGLPGLSAWDGLRALRVLMAGARLGFCGEATAWGAARAIAVELGQRYRSFDELAVDYLAARRRFHDLPADGSDDDSATFGCAQSLHVQRMNGWSGVAFGSFVEAPTHGIRDAATFRAALLPTASRTAPPAITRCRYCRAAKPAAHLACARCGGPVGTHT